MRYIGLDLAIVSGICVLNAESKEAFLFQHKGTPLELLSFLVTFVLDGTTTQKVGIEELHQFRNATTTRSLLQRSGFIRYTLESYQIDTKEVNMESVLSILKLKSKQDLFDYIVFGTESLIPLTSNHTDALGIALYMYYLDKGNVLAIEDLVITTDIPNVIA